MTKGQAEVAPSFEEVLGQRTAEQWIRDGLAELAKAEAAFAARQQVSAAAALKRASGMALNGALRVIPREGWGRNYVEHLRALASDLSVPEPVRDAASALLRFEPGVHGLLFLRVRSEDERLVEAARTVMAHAYAIIHGRVGRPAEPCREVNKSPSLGVGG